MTEKKTNFMDAVKAAQSAKKVPQATTAKVQAAKFRTQVNSNKPTRRANGRG
jgi:hypothetical protein